jgi:cation:H+ antiporter
VTAFDLVRFVVGLGLLIGGGELLVRGASRIAVIIGISPLVVGLTVVALGTSSPELAVSVQAALDGNADIALGNVIGSNIANVLLILGLSAMIASLTVARQLVRFDVPIMIGVSVLLFGMAHDGRISTLDGAGLVFGLILYTAYVIYQSRKEESGGAGTDAAANVPGGVRGVVVNIVMALIGLGLLVLGASWLVASAVSVATVLGVSSLVIGLTVIAVGTSMPEIATSIIAALRGERDIAVGNVVGSNLFNIMAVLGITSVIAPGGIAVPESVLHFDLPIMIAVAVACLPIFVTGHCIERWEGFVFFGYYVAYTVYLVLDATEHDHLQTYNTAMIWFVMPLTALTIGVVTVRSLRQRRQRPARA